MKRIFLHFLLIFIFSCDDGDLEIETIDFDNVAVQSCETVTTSTIILFKIDNDEAIVLTLQSGLLANEVTPENEPRTSNINSQSELIYRIFDGKVAKNYFCDAIPPISPKVIEEVSATSGVVAVTTVVSETDANIFEHTITLSGLTLMNSKGERITDLTTINFGTVTTTAN